MRHSEHSEESKKGDIMGKMKEQNTEQEEKEVTEENTVIEAPEDITGEVPASNEQEANADQEEAVEDETVEAPESITGDAPVEENPEESVEVKYKAKACIYYGNKKIMPGEVLLGVEANTIHSLLKNGFIELV